MNINRVVLTGNLTREPELRRTATGMAILDFGLAVNDRRKDENGEWTDYANFFDCTMFGTRAESVSGYLNKGNKIGIEGKLHYGTWTDKKGNKQEARKNLQKAVELGDSISKELLNNIK